VAASGFDDGVAVDAGVEAVGAAEGDGGKGAGGRPDGTACGCDDAGGGVARGATVCAVRLQSASARNAAAIEAAERA
jgi:hypothetical protein